MFGFYTQPSFMPCDQCGASVARSERDSHVCDEQRRLDYAMFQLRTEISGFDEQWRTFLASPRGRFEAYDATRRRPPLQET